MVRTRETDEKKQEDFFSGDESTTELSGGYAIIKDNGGKKQLILKTGELRLLTAPVSS